MKFNKLKWWARADLNRRPIRYERGLPTRKPRKPLHNWLVSLQKMRNESKTRILNCSLEQTAQSVKSAIKSNVRKLRRPEVMLKPSSDGLKF